MASSRLPPDASVVRELRELVRPHIDSFDWFIRYGLDEAVDSLEPEEFEEERAGARLSLWLNSASLLLPKSDARREQDLYPSECRRRAASYTAQLRVTLNYSVNGGPPLEFERALGQVPVMVCSAACHLRKLDTAELVRKREERHELGGYFIANGNERAIRLLIVPRRNHITGIVRSSFKNRGPTFTQYATVIRCANADQSSLTVALHLLSTGSARLRITISKNEFFIPVVLVLRAFRDCSDKEIYERALAGAGDDPFVADRVIEALRENRDDFDVPLRTRAECLVFLGQRFRGILRRPPWESDEEAGMVLLRRHVFIHLEHRSESGRGGAKWELLLLMLQRLYALAAGRVSADNPDSLVNQEVLLPGHLWTMMMREQLGNWVRAVGASIKRELGKPNPLSVSDEKLITTALRGASDKVDPGKALSYFIATGNLRSESGLDLQQTAGFTIVAERLNYFRFLAHFRSIHRGAFFAQLRTTTVRKLLPDQWGFLCPVHTPDGSPCGLLSHLAEPCSVAVEQPPRGSMRAYLLPHLAAAGVALLPLAAGLPASSYLPVLLDGEVIGFVHVDAAPATTSIIRRLKVVGPDSPDVAAPLSPPSTLGALEIALILPGGSRRPPALYLASHAARPLRPVSNLSLKGRVELIGPLEQTTLRVSYGIEDPGRGEASHAEIESHKMLSLVASLTPFCDFNQSPRNMYQCQMGKQTMGVPFHAIGQRSETKAYHLHTPQSPIVRTSNYTRFGMDEYPLGTNAVIAVISYTGYDMEDAMIVNKASYERGFAHASVRTTVEVNLNKLKPKGGAPHHRFGNLLPPDGPASSSGQPQKKFCETLGADGLPDVGQALRDGDPICAILDLATGDHELKLHKSSGGESGGAAIVEEVRLVGGDGNVAHGAAEAPAVFIRLRYNRNPIPGDKFATRHGQKGVLSRLWPQEDMPFTESGLTPDVLFNPHGFPSRMTIGMLLEIMAAKSGALHGVTQDATPFKFSDKHRAVDYFGEQLRKAGFAYHGTESMYSGLYGTEMEVQIFVGVVYYQRLRHMVSDKHQVRARGPINPLTRQPVHGRKIHGGIRLGEMERDALLAHGVAYLVHDRLFHCSDEARTLVCTKCGSLLAPRMKPPEGPTARLGARETLCAECGDGSNVDVISLPYVFMYLTNELAAMNIKVSVDTKAPGVLR